MGWWGQAGRGSHAEIDAEIKPSGRCWLTNATRNHWHVERTADGQPFVALELIDRVSGTDYRGRREIVSWAYKPLSEDMGPSECDAPLAALAEAQPAPAGDGGATSAGWRARVHAHHALRADINHAPVGSILRTGEREYQLIERRGRTLIVRSLQNGNRYRLPRTHISAVYPAEARTVGAAS